MPEQFAKPLSVEIDYRGDEPKIVIDGTNYARNIALGGVDVHSFAPTDTSSTRTAKVTVTFMVDDLRILSRNAPSEEVVVDMVCGGVA